MAVYLLHFSARLSGHAQHYLGSADDIPARLADHESGRGARIMAAAKAAGLTWVVARTWPGGRTAERHLKGRKIGSHELRGYCPECQVMPRINRWAGGGPYN